MDGTPTSPPTLLGSRRQDSSASPGKSGLNSNHGSVSQVVVPEGPLGCGVSQFRAEAVLRSQAPPNFICGSLEVGLWNTVTAEISLLTSNCLWTAEPPSSIPFLTYRNIFEAEPNVHEPLLV